MLAVRVSGYHGMQGTPKAEGFLRKRPKFIVLHFRSNITHVTLRAFV